MSDQWGYQPWALGKKRPEQSRGIFLAGARIGGVPRRISGAVGADWAMALPGSRNRVRQTPTPSFEPISRLMSRNHRMSPNHYISATMSSTHVAGVRDTNTMQKRFEAPLRDLKKSGGAQRIFLMYVVKQLLMA